MQGDVRDVPVICGQIAATAQELSALALPLASLPGSPDAHRKRRKLLLDIRQQCAFSRAILRRWRRSMMARQQLLEMRMPATTYSEPSRPAMEP